MIQKKSAESAESQRAYLLGRLGRLLTPPDEVSGKANENDSKRERRLAGLVLEIVVESVGD